MRLVRKYWPGAVLVAAAAVASTPAAAQNAPQELDVSEIGFWDHGCSAFANGVALCTVVAETNPPNSLAFSFVGGDPNLYVAFRPEPGAGFSEGDDVSFDVALEIGAETQDSSEPLNGFVALDEFGPQLVFAIDERAIEFFQRANFVVFDYAGGLASRFSLAGGRRALDALENCARDRL